MSITFPHPAVIEVTDTVTVEPVTLDPDNTRTRRYAAAIDYDVLTDGTHEISWAEDDDMRVTVLASVNQDGEDVLGVSTDGLEYRIRPVDTYDALNLSAAGVPQPLRVVQAEVLRGGGAVAQELDAAVAGDNTVVTLVLETGLGVYVRFSADWQLLSDTSDSLEDLSLVAVAPEALDVFDAADAAATSISVFDLPVPGPDTADLATVVLYPPQENVDLSLSDVQSESLTAAGLSIPQIDSADDLPLALRYAETHPDAQWYVAKKAISLGYPAPASWLVSTMIGQQLALDVSDEPATQLMLDLSSPEGVQASAISLLIEQRSGRMQHGEMNEVVVRALIAAARRFDMLDDSALRAALDWREWLHPRGRDGKFIQKFAIIDVFQDVDVSSTNKNRRRATVRNLTPEGVEVTYNDGRDSSADYPTIIPTSQTKKIQLAPLQRARLDDFGKIEANKGIDPDTPGAEQQAEAAYKPGVSMEQYQSNLDTFNASLTPPNNANERTGTTITDEEFTDHVNYVSNTMNRALANNFGTDAAFKDSNGMWTEERMLVFLDLVNEQVQKVADKPKQRRGIMTGGLGGAGKSSTLDVLAQEGKYRRDDWVTVNPDDFKELMIEKGLAPKVTGLSPSEAAPLMHEESSQMADMFAEALMAEGHNIIFDVTMGGGARLRALETRERNTDVWKPAEVVHTADYQINRLESKGYVVDGLFVDISIDQSVQRAEKRHRRGLDELRTGTTYRKDPDTGNYEPTELEESKRIGGRYVPPKIIQKNTWKPATGELGEGETPKYSSLNQENFDKVRTRFRKWIEFNNEGKAPEETGRTGNGAKDDDTLLPMSWDPTAEEAMDRWRSGEFASMSVTQLVAELRAMEGDPEGNEDRISYIRQLLSDLGYRGATSG